MAEQYNRIVKAFGANRVRLIGIKYGLWNFSIDGWAEFLLDDRGLTEWVGSARITTNRSQWLEAVSLGKKRDDEGNLS